MKINDKKNLKESVKDTLENSFEVNSEEDAVKILKDKNIKFTDKKKSAGTNDIHYIRGEHKVAIYSPNRKRLYIVSEKLGESLKEYKIRDISMSDSDDAFTKEEQAEFNIDEFGQSLDSYDQYVHCSWCGDVTSTDQAKKELNMGWLCPSCVHALRSRGEKVVFEESKKANTSCNKKSLKESRFEGKDPDKEYLYYDDVPVDVYSYSRDWETGDYYHRTVHIDWYYEIDKDDIKGDILIDFLPAELDNADDETVEKYLDDHYDELLNQHMDEVLKFYKERAYEDAQENSNEDYYSESYKVKGKKAVHMAEDFDGTPELTFELVYRHLADNFGDKETFDALKNLALYISREVDCNYEDLREAMKNWLSDWVDGIAQSEIDRVAQEIIDEANKGITEAKTDYAKPIKPKKFKGYKKGELGTFQTFNPNAGNVEANNAFFNMSMGANNVSGVGTADGGVGAVSSGVAEGLEEDQIHSLKDFVEKQKSEYNETEYNIPFEEESLIFAIQEYAGMKGEFTDADKDYIEDELKLPLGDILDLCFGYDEDKDDFSEIISESTKPLKEGKIKNIMIEIEDAGGKDAYINEKESELKELEDYLSYLSTTAMREVGRGGNFDSQDDIEDSMNETANQIEELRNKIEFVKS